MLGLFKTKLNTQDHLDIINYLIVEEAEQQWNYHAMENNFNKKAFRSPSFAKGVVNMFVTKILKMKADDKLLGLIADLGFRRCKEYIDEYKDNEKHINKLTEEKLFFIYFSIEVYFDHVHTKHSDLKDMNAAIMVQGKDVVDFKYRKEAYELIAETNRQLQLVGKIINKKSTKQKVNDKIEKYKKKWIKLKEKDRISNITVIRNLIIETIQNRNPNNLLSLN